MIIIITTKKMCNFQIGQWFWKKKNTLHFWYFFTLSSILCEYLSRRKLDKIESTRSGQFSSSTENSAQRDRVTLMISRWTRGSCIRGRQGSTDTARVNEASWLAWIRLTDPDVMQIRAWIAYATRRFIIRG